jgi:hypothetical protein
MSTYHLIPNVDDFNEDIADVDRGVHDYIWSERRTLFLATCSGSIAVCCALWALETAYYGEFLQSLGSRIFWYPAAVLFCPAALYTHFKTQMQHLFMRQLAQALKFDYAAAGSLESVEGKIFALGSGRKIEDVLSGTYQGHPIRIFDYAFTIHEGRSSHTERYTIFALAFDCEIPDIALTPKSFLSAATLSTAPDDGIKITLESNFNEHFNLYAPRFFDVEIREILQPDLMAELIDKYQSYRIETAGNTLYVICPLITNKAKFLAAHDLTDNLFARMVPRLLAIAAPEPAAV